MNAFFVYGKGYSSAGQFPGRSRLNWPEADKLAWHFGLEKTGQLTGLASSKQASSKTGQFKTGQFWKQASSKQASSETGQLWNRPVQNWFSHLVPTFGHIAGPFLVQFIPWDRGNNCYVLVDKHHGKCWILLTALFFYEKKEVIKTNIEVCSGASAAESD